MMAHAVAGCANAVSRLFGRRRRLRFQGHLHQLLMPVAEVTMNGHRFRLTVPDRSAAHWPLAGIDSEPGTVRWIDSFADGDVFYDVGANVGIFSLYAATARRCVCVAFAPNPFSFDALVRNLVVNGLEKAIFPFRFALGDNHCIAAIGIATAEAGSVGCTLAEPDDGRLQLLTMVTTLDKIVDVAGLPFPNHLKIDVDGNEDPILAGAQTVLGDQRLRSLLVEIVCMSAERREQLTANLERLGLELVPSEGSSDNWLFRRRPGSAPR